MTYRSKTPRLAALAALAFVSGHVVDLCAAASTRRHATNFGTDDSSSMNALNIKADFCPHAGGAETMAALTPEQSTTDIAGAAPAARHAKKANTVKFTGLGTSVCAISFDGIGSASAPAAKNATCIGSGEALGANCDEAGVIDFGSSCDDEGKAPMALVAAAAKKASGAARRRAGSHYVVDRGSLGGELIEILATGLELGPARFSLRSGAADSPSATPLHPNTKK